MALHIINHSYSNASLDSCLRTLAANDVILFIEDGVYCVKRNTATSKKLLELTKQIDCYALLPDLTQRGLQDNIIQECQCIDYEDFVDLTVNHEQIVSW